MRPHDFECLPVVYEFEGDINPILKVRTSSVLAAAKYT